MSKIRIRKGDRVHVITGKDKGKEGKVLRYFPVRDMILVEGVNVMTKHVKPSAKNPQSGIVKQEAPIYSSKVKLVCTACGAATRVGRAFLENGRKVRVCKKCGEIIDKA